MPTFENAKADAEELGHAARALAYATRGFDAPEDTYEVLGSLRQALSGVQQSLGQLAAWHERSAPFAATDDGDRDAGGEHAAKAAGWLTIAAASVEQVIQLVMHAHSENGRIAWQPDTRTPPADTLAQREAALDPDPPSSTGRPEPSGGLAR